MKAIIMILGIIGLIPGTLQSDDIITIYYTDHIPYFYRDARGEVRGVVADSVALVFEKAGVPYRFKESPAKRQMYDLRRGSPNICGIGWYKTPEREKFAKYSLPIYKNKTRIALTRKDNDLLNFRENPEGSFP
jgi:ABC-type amino acid transport substrate-binding protein